MKRGIAVAALMVAAAVGYGAEAEVGVDVASSYVWRGITFNDGVVIQPSVTVAEKGFSLNVWGNMDLGTYGGTLERGDFSEIDLTLAYGFDAYGLSFEVGVIDYLFPGSDADGTIEIYGTLGKDFECGISASATLYYDVDEVQDFYVSADIGYEIPVCDDVSASVSAAIGYAGEDASAGDEGGLHDYTVSGGVSYTLSDMMSLGATVSYTGSIDEDVLPEQDTDVYGVLSASCSF